MKIAGYLGGLFGVAVLAVLAVRSDLPAMAQALESAGWPLLWLVPYRALYFLSFAVGWFWLLHPYDPYRRAGLGYVFWATTVREAIDRLLPVASVGGGVIGVRLLRWRGIAGAPAGATVLVEIVLTLFVIYGFTALGLILLLDMHQSGTQYRRFLLGFVLSVPAPILVLLLLRYGSVFARLHKYLGPLVGAGALSGGAESLDQELQACLGRWTSLTGAGLLQLTAVSMGSIEVWFALRLFGHPVGLGSAVILESMTQAMRHLAFIVPAGLGVQEATLVLFGHALGIGGDLALAVSMAKRVREVACGVPSLLSWQWMEARRLRGAVREPSR